MAELLDLRVDRVGKPEVLRALERVWTSQSGTGRKLRTALGALFRHARAAGLIEVDPVLASLGTLPLANDVPLALGRGSRVRPRSWAGRRG